jgi:hypothetical protein
MMLHSLTINTKYFFMPNIKEIIVASVLPAIKEVGKLEMKEVLSGIKEHNEPEVYKNILRDLHVNFSLMRRVAITTRTIVDDGIIELVLEAVRETAEVDNIKFV